MKHIFKTLVIGSFILIATGSVAEDMESIDIKKLPDGSIISVDGVIENVENPKRFTLHHDAGSIAVEVGENEDFIVAEGKKVTVDGTINNGVISESSLRSAPEDFYKGRPADNDQ